MWFSVVCTLIDNDARHHSGQNVVDSRGAQHIVTTMMTRIVVDKSTYHAEYELKRHCVTQASVVWTLLDNGKIANQITR